jgi:hypothetical protein
MYEVVLSHVASRPEYKIIIRTVKYQNQRQLLKFLATNFDKINNDSMVLLYINIKVNIYLLNEGF